MKKYVDGELIEMTQKELDELEELKEKQVSEKPSIDERISAIEDVILNLLYEV